MISMNERRATTRSRIAAGSRRVLVAFVLLAGCTRVQEAANQLFDDRTPRERYAASLEAAGLTRTALVQDWQVAADRALREAAVVKTPYTEVGYLTPAEPAALAFRLSARRGQNVHIDVELQGDSTTLLFLDAWQLESDTAATLRALTSADSAARTLEFEPRRDGEFVLRVQPELLRGGRFRVAIRVEPTLAFPVHRGHDGDIGSDFGDPRDGGVRDHHGVDIFAPRGTPALAVAEATVTRVEVTPRGGKVVWLRDRRGNSLYYAHLDSQRVAAGTTVRPGDTLGFVGNTGNARTTPPHLHFGVYRRGEGPVDPYWFVARPRGTQAALTADTARLGEWARTPRATVLRAAPEESATRLGELPQHTALRILAASGSWFRVRLPDGGTGYIAARATERVDRAIRTAAPAPSSQLLARPLAASGPDDVLALVAPGETVGVLGRFGDFLLVRTPDGRPAWMIQ
jgi:murein DD-endopeptidase MepM/ murein hydrolase activator NlpD